MMSALAMLLTAAMVVPGDMPEMVSGEVIQEFQRLDLSGKWKGTAHNLVGFSGKVRLSKGTLDLTGNNGQRLGLEVSFADEGKGTARLRIKILGTECAYLGIYQRNRSRPD